MNETEWAAHRDAKKRAVEAIRGNAARSTALPHGLKWLTGQAIQAREFSRPSDPDQRNIENDRSGTPWWRDQ